MVIGSNTRDKKIFFKSVTVDDIIGETLDANLFFSDQ
jgi:hypothetical protein